MDDFDWTFDRSTPAQLLAIFTDPNFLADFAAAIPVAQHHADFDRDGEHLTVILRWQFPTDHVPSMFRQFVPAEVKLDWQTTWNTADSVAISGIFDAVSKDPAVTFNGRIKITPTAEGATAWHVSGDVQAQRRGFIPASLVARALESLFHSVLTDQRTVAESWLGIDPAGRPVDQH